jgi:hypothetical protein
VSGAPFEVRTTPQGEGNEFAFAVKSLVTVEYP